MKDDCIDRMLLIKDGKDKTGMSYKTISSNMLNNLLDAIEKECEFMQRNIQF